VPPERDINLVGCYNDRRVISFILKQARHGFQGIRGQVGEDF
jgi:hypothetical protein